MTVNKFLCSIIFSINALFWIILLFPWDIRLFCSQKAKFRTARMECKQSVLIFNYWTLYIYIKITKMDLVD